MGCKPGVEAAAARHAERMRVRILKSAGPERQACHVNSKYESLGPRMVPGENKGCVLERRSYHFQI